MGINTVVDSSVFDFVTPQPQAQRIVKLTYIFAAGTVQHLLSERDEDTFLPRYTSLQDNIARLREQTLPKMNDEEVSGRWRLITDPWLPPKSYRVIDEEYKWKSSDRKCS